jgi:hypothetical protein
MNAISPRWLAVGVFAVALTAQIVLHIFMTRERRRLLREIQRSVDQHMCRFSAQQRRGDPTVFRIDGETFSQLPWSLQSHGAVGKGRGWSYLMELTFSSLGGMLDMAVLPRDHKAVTGKTDLCPSQAREFPSGLADFDTVYEVLSATPQLSASPLSTGLAKRFLKWPGDTVAPQSFLAWRDPAGCHLRVHLPKMPNWSTIEYMLMLGEDFCASLPTPVLSGASAIGGADFDRMR